MVFLALALVFAPASNGQPGGAACGSQPASATPQCDQDPEKDDCREDFEASFYLGLGVDTFAASELRGYLNPQAATSSKERGVGGFSFAYRLAGAAKPANNEKAPAFQRWFKKGQLWVYGETVHGVRSADIDCGQNREFPTCQGLLSLDVFQRRPDQDLLYIIRNASSLEGFAGLRYEFLTLQSGGASPARLYLKGQLGFLKVSGAPDDAVDMHHFGLGAIATKGPFQGSYLEAGFGRTDLYAVKSKDRWKFDGFLSRKLTDGVSFFAQIVVDSDFGKGSDSIQSYVGLEFDLKNVSRLFRPGGGSTGTGSGGKPGPGGR